MIRPFVKKIAECFDKDEVKFFFYNKTAPVKSDLVQYTEKDDNHSVFSITKTPPIVEILCVPNDYMRLYVNKTRIYLEADERIFIELAAKRHEQRIKDAKEQEEKAEFESLVAEIERW